MTVLLDVTALLLRRDEPVMTGIDRVDYALARWLCRADTDTAFLVQIGRLRGVIDRTAMAHELERMVARRGLSGGDGSLLADVAAALDGPREAAGLQRIGSPARPRKLLAGLRAGLVALTHARGRGRQQPDGLHFVHASHRGLEKDGRYDWALAAGVRATVFVHDLIPLDHPEFCGAGARASHGPKLATAARLATAHPDGCIAVNSQHTAARVHDWLAGHGLPIPRIEVHRLGTGPLAERAASPPVDLTAARPYFVCAGTIEGRKNIGLLLAVWRGLLARRAHAAMPVLVLAGSRGWRCADVLSDLDSAGDIAPHVIEVAGLDDAALDALIDGARAVLTPSLAEGFSLVPAGALARGVPVVASDIPAHRELRGVPVVASDIPAHRELRGAITLLPAQDVDGWRATVARLCKTRPAPRTCAPGRTWEEFAAGLFAPPGVNRR